MKKETKVRAHTRRTKSGRVVNVKASKREYQAAEDIAKDAIRKGKDAGSELEKRKAKSTDYDQYGSTKEELEAGSLSIQNIEKLTSLKIKDDSNILEGAKAKKAIKALTNAGYVYTDNHLIPPKGVKGAVYYAKKGKFATLMQEDDKELVRSLKSGDFLDTYPHQCSYARRKESDILREKITGKKPKKPKKPNKPKSKVSGKSDIGFF